jgi:hypothetical protein
MVGGGRRGHVAAARKTGASESWRATAEEAERGGALGRWALHSARRVCVRCVCAVVQWHLVLVPARVGLLGAFRRLPLAQELGLHAQSQAQARSRLCVAAVAVLYCGREHGAFSAGCGHRFPTAGSGSTHRRLCLRPRRQNQPRRVQVLRMRECHAAFASPIPPMPMAHANGRSSTVHSSDRSDKIRSDKIG